MFAAFALAFAFKVPMFPFHTWLPDAHVDAPTAGSVILAAVLLKMGTYGFLRFAMPLFTVAAVDLAPIIGTLAVIGILYGALVAMVQKDIKKLVAYSSVAHLGFVMLGLFAFNVQGIEGGILQMVNHGISTGALFLLVGILYERRHTRLISEYGGLSKVLPLYAACFMIITLSSIGLPGMNGFVGEFLILVGAFQPMRALTVVAASGVIFAAVYMLWMFRLSSSSSSGSAYIPRRSSGRWTRRVRPSWSGSRRSGRRRFPAPPPGKRSSPATSTVRT
jgi:NADH-quinone oxidoreductase subunit M